MCSYLYRCIQENHPTFRSCLVTQIAVDKAKQISLLQRNRSPLPPPTTQQDMEQQTDAEVKDEETSEEKIETNEKTKVGQQILGDIKHLKGSKHGKASQILDEILKSEYFSFDTN